MTTLLDEIRAKPFDSLTQDELRLLFIDMEKELYKVKQKHTLELLGNIPVRKKTAKASSEVSAESDTINNNNNNDPVLIRFEDKYQWRDACKELESVVMNYVSLNMSDPGTAFPLKVLAELEALISTTLFQQCLKSTLGSQHFAEQKAKEIRTALQSASNAYSETVRDEAGFQIAQPYKSFMQSVCKHMLLGVTMEIAGSGGFKYKGMGGVGSGNLNGDTLRKSNGSKMEVKNRNRSKERW